nr:reverse transcriptase domain, reverse transcriptase zinc-binding domain protein [Tanacetum cinerariifolium]
MANTKSWDPIVDKFSKRLSKWKSDTLSIGRRATLISSVLGATGTYYFSLFPMPATVNTKLESLRSKFFWGSDHNTKKIPWISWKQVIASKDKGGLGIGTIHGENGDTSSFYNHVRDQGVWGRITRSINIMNEKGLIPFSFLQRRVSNALNKDCSIRDCWNNGWSFNWIRPIRSAPIVFTVKSTRTHIDEGTLPDRGIATRWNRYLPKKINIFTWRMLRDRLPTRWNLSHKASADNRSPMLEKYLYDSWKSHMEFYIENRENGRMILDSVQNGPLIWPTVVQEDGLPPDVYAIVNYHKVAKEIWDKVKLLMQGKKLSLQEKECKLYDEFDKFSFVKGETLYRYYWRFSQLINNMNVFNMSMRPVQVNTKFLNSLPPKWSKFVMDMKLARDLHTTNYDQLYSYLEQHEIHANETRLMRERYQDPLAFFANYHQSPSQLNNYHSQYNLTHFPQQTYMIPQVHSPQSYSPMYPSPHPLQPQISHSSVPPSQQYQSHMNHQTSYVPQIAYHPPQASTQPMTEVIAQQVQGRQGQSYSGTGYKSNATSSRGNYTGGHARVMKCYNCQGEGHMVKQCTQPKRPKNAAWFKENAMLAEAHEAGQNFDEEQLVFLADPGIPYGQAAQKTIINTAAF